MSEKKKEVDKSIYPEVSPQSGEPMTAEGYQNIELAEKLNAYALEDHERQMKLKFGAMYDRLDKLANASIAAMQFICDPAKDQLQVMALAHNLMPNLDLRGLDIESEWALYQAWLCKRAGLDIKGVQAFRDYFYPTAKEEIAAIEEASKEE